MGAGGLSPLTLTTGDIHHNYTRQLAAGRSGLAVARLTAVREVLGSNHAAGSCVYRKNHCDLQPWARAVCSVHPSCSA